MNKKTITSAFDYIALKLKVLVKEKESDRRKLEVAAEELKDKAEALADTAKEKEDVRKKLEVTAEQLATTAKEKEDIRLKLVVTARKLALKAKQLVVIAKEKEDVRKKLAITAENLRLQAEQLAVIAKEREDARRKLAVTAKQLAITAKDKEDIRLKLVTTAGELRLKAEALADTAKEKEDVRKKLVVTAEKLATAAEEKEDVRKKLALAAEELKKSRETLEDKVLERTRNLANAKARNDAILASIGDGLVAVDKMGKILMVNNAFENLVGWKRKEVLGKLLIDVVPREDEAGNIVPFKERVLTKILSTTTTTTSADWYYIRKDKTRFPVSIIVTPVVLDGKTVGAVETFRDITKEKEVDRAKSEFVTIASHELRTPLTAIDGLVSMMLDGEYGEVSKNLKQPLEDVNTSSERLIHLVNDLLNLSRIQAGRLKYTLSEFSIADVITEVVHLLQPLSKQKGLQLTATKIDPITVQGDSDKVKQILNNLIGNSLKFTDKGSITVSTKLNEDTVEIDVTDTGIGITKEDQSKLFGQFVQLESGQGKPAGTGLGLHISKEVVRKMGGDLWIAKSKVGIGSTFTFSIPLAKSSVALKAKKEIEKEIKQHLDQKSDTMKLI